MQSSSGKVIWNQLAKIKEQQDISKIENPGPGDDPWTSVSETVLQFFRGKPLKMGNLSYLYDCLSVITSQRSSTFVVDHFQKDILEKGMDILYERTVSDVGSSVNILLSLNETWNFFFTELINILEACFYKVRLKNNSTIRKMCLTVFRDEVFLRLDLGPILDLTRGCDYQKDYPALCQMCLVLQSIQDSYPPNQNQLKLEKLVARVISPYLGFLGLYEGNDQPTVYSDEIRLASNYSNSGQGGCRRLSRPLALSSGQLDKLSELFRRTAIRSSLLHWKSSDTHLYQKSLRTS